MIAKYSILTWTFPSIAQVYSICEFLIILFYISIVDVNYKELLRKMLQNAYVIVYLIDFKTFKTPCN